jgi:hypothetical protein
MQTLWFEKSLVGTSEADLRFLSLISNSSEWRGFLAGGAFIVVNTFGRMPPGQPDYLLLEVRELTTPPIALFNFYLLDLGAEVARPTHAYSLRDFAVHFGLKPDPAEPTRQRTWRDRPPLL